MKPSVSYPSSMSIPTIPLSANTKPTWLYEPFVTALTAVSKELQVCGAVDEAGIFTVLPLGRLESALEILLSEMNEDKVEINLINYQYPCQI